MKQVCRPNLTKPAESLIKSVCYPGENKFPNAVENCIEVKCPYCIRNCKLDETVVITTCLKASDGTFQLNVLTNIIAKYKPSYFFQTRIMLTLCYGQCQVYTLNVFNQMLR